MKIKKREHKIWEEFKNAKLDHEIKCPVGKWQYIYSTDKGEISLIVLPNYYGHGLDIWEICCLKGDLFEDIERFNSKTEAVNRIKGLLEGGDENERRN